MSKVNTSELVIPLNIQSNWQNIVNLAAEMMGVPSALIMRIHPDNIEVFSANDNKVHSYSKGDSESLGQGLYCENVIDTQQPLLVPNCFKDAFWSNNPDIALGMVAYFGLPINWPNGDPFGTLCVLDTKENPLTDVYQRLLSAFKDCVESQLATLFQHQALKSTHQALQTRVSNRAQNIADLNYSLSIEISKRQQAERQVEYQKLHDIGTGFLNRKALEQRLNNALSTQEENHESMLAVVHIAFGNGRRLQTKYGYAPWDDALIEFRQRLNELSSHVTVTGRPTSSELVIIIKDVHNESELQRLSQHIADISMQKAIIGEESVHLHAHIGVATSRETLTASELLTFASEAALSSRDSGHKFSFYQSSHSEPALYLNKQESYLLQAVRNDDLLLYFQPKVDPETRRWTGAEALLRWKHPVLGDISNEGLIKLAEQNGLIFEVGNFVLRTAIEKAAHWASLVDDFSIAINVSSVQLKNPNFSQQVEDLIECYNVPPQCIELEITEGGLISDEVLAQETLHKLKQIGVTLSLDDFGTGYASFSYLKKYPFDGIKVDKVFLHQIDENQQDKEIVRSIIHVAKKLELTVTVEGVETLAHEEFVTTEGGDIGQGYFYGKPMPCDEFEFYLTNQSPTPNNPRQIEL
ncbi:sensor domain-containing phosphodiesterase [Vibrio agarivorans]|uniref:sensor domain-containing phosphodiesterase n=1 Tax=Vibrio agarivorans TaxID=153622 RepID=UPI00222E1037|nr:EAL domain-containing protein [Vibrio agarivorans]